MLQKSRFKGLSGLFVGLIGAAFLSALLAGPVMAQTMTCTGRHDIQDATFIATNCKKSDAKKDAMDIAEAFAEGYCFGRDEGCDELCEARGLNTDTVCNEVGGTDCDGDLLWECEVTLFEVRCDCGDRPEIPETPEPQ